MPVFRINDKRLSETVSDLAQRGWTICTMDGAAIEDDTTFFRATMRGWPMGDASHSQAEAWLRPENWNWNAFEDFFWQGLLEHAGTYVACIWLNADYLENKNPETFAAAIESIGFALENNLESAGHTPETLHILLVGSSAAYADLVPVVSSG